MAGDSTPAPRRVRTIALGLAPVVAGIVAGVLIGTRDFHTLTSFARSAGAGTGKRGAGAGVTVIACALLR